MQVSRHDGEQMLDSGSGCVIRGRAKCQTGLDNQVSERDLNKGENGGSYILMLTIVEIHTFTSNFNFGSIT